jgi:transposase
MLTMEHIYHIRYEYNEKEKSLRQIAKETGHDRKTISKYVGQKDFNLPKPKLSSRKKKTDQYKRLVIQWLKEDEKAPRKQRHSAHRNYDRLAE